MTFEVNTNTQNVIDLMNENTQLKMLLHKALPYIEETKTVFNIQKEIDVSKLCARIRQVLQDFTPPTNVT